MKTRLLLALVAVGCGGGNPSSSGPDAFASDCPEECIPGCHLSAIAVTANCFPHGSTVCEGAPGGDQNLCYDNGVKDARTGTVEQGDVDLRRYDSGALCFDFDEHFDPNPPSGYLGYTLKGPDDTVLEEVELPTPDDTNVFDVLCNGERISVDLNVNATNPACSACPATPLQMAENPDDPTPAPDCNGSCTVP